MNVFRKRQLFREVPTFIFVLTMIILADVLYYRIVKKPLTENRKLFVEGCGGSVAIFLGVIVSVWRGRRNEMKAKDEGRL